MAYHQTIVLDHLTWKIGASCDRIFYTPGETVMFTIDLSNTTNKFAKVSNVSLLFDFGKIHLNGKFVLVGPGKQIIFHRAFRIPASVWGKRRFRMT